MRASRKARPTFTAEYDLWKAGHRVIVGVDEGGVGAMAGPIVAAAVLLPLSEVDVDLTLRELAELWWEVRDSRDIADAKKERLDTLIRQTARVEIGIVEVAELAEKGLSSAASRVATERALDALSRPLDAVLLDGDIGLPARDLVYRKIAKVRGVTTSLTISAASIVASVHFNRLMCAFGEQYPEYGFSEHKGYVTVRHKDALRRYGPCPIHHPHHKIVRSALADRS